MRSFNLSSPILSGFAAAIISVAHAFAQTHAVEPDSDWAAVLEEARGQTVYFNAWGGSDRINEYLRWSADALESEYGVTSCSTSRCSCNWNLVFNCS